MSLSKIFYGLWFAACAASLAHGNTITLNLSCGYLYDSAGTAIGNRVPPDALCVLVADWDGDGFDPADGDWVSGDDRLITVFDSEFPLVNGGTQGFDLASGSTEAGFFNRGLGIDLAQFVGRTDPLPVALRWFPTIRAASVSLPTSKPAVGTPYGEFFRIPPIYGEGFIGWSLKMSDTGLITFDPFATDEFGGQDPKENGMALWRVLSGVKAMESRLELADMGFATLKFRGAPSTQYVVQRSLDLITWETQAAPSTDAFGACLWVDPTPLLDRAFYRIASPVPGP